MFVNGFEFPPLLSDQSDPGLIPSPTALGDRMLITDMASNIHINATGGVFFNGVRVDVRHSPAFIYVMGGTDARGLSNNNIVERFEPAAGRWESMPSMLVVRRAAGAAVFNKNLFVTGGYNVGGSTERFDGVRWTMSATMNVARADHAVCIFRGSIFASGGATTWAGQPQATTEQFDGSVWSTAVPMLEKRYSHGLVEFNARLYAVGGYDGVDRLRSIEVFDGSSWKHGPPMAWARNAPGVAVVGSSMLAVAGSNTSGLLSSIESFDGKAWTTIAPLPNPPRYNFATVVWSGVLFVIGGRSWDSAGALATVDKVEFFDGSGWMAQAPTKSSRWNPAFAVF